MPIKHKFVSEKADGTDVSRVQPTGWNEEHEITGFLSKFDQLSATPNAVPFVDAAGNGALAPSTTTGRAILAIASFAALLTELAGAPLDSPVFTGAPRAPTPDALDNSTRLATTEFVRAAVAALVGSSPATLDTLQELADALGNDPDFAATTAAALGNRVRVDDNQGLSPAQQAQGLLNLGVVIGTAANNVLRLDAGGKLPAVDGSQLLGIVFEGALRFDQAQALSDTEKATARANVAADTLPGHLWGLTLSNNATDVTNDIDIAAGSCADSTGLVRMVLASALTKRLDAAWAVGSGNGGLRGGTLIDGTFHVYVISGAGEPADVCFDASATAPNLPTGYTDFRRIGSIVRKGGAILPFRQDGNNFEFVTPVTDAAAVAYAAAGTDYLVTLTVPTGISVRALINVHGSGTGGNLAWGAADQSLVADNASSQVSNSQKALLAIRTDTLGRVKTRSSTSTAQYTVGTRGWIDTRV